MQSRKEKFRIHHHQLQRKFTSNNLDVENYQQKSLNNIPINTNVRNFDDWIWGKHSVFAALNIKDLLTEFGVLLIYFLQRNSFYY